MKQILLAIDASSPDKSSINFACYLAALTGSRITGVFLENLVANEEPVLRKTFGATYIDWQLDENSEAYKEKCAQTEQHIAAFEHACRERNVRCSIHRDKGSPTAEMINESRYADVLIVDADTSFNKRYDGVPSGFVRDILKESECPVIIAPADFYAIDEIVFAFDNSRSAAFAIKQFTYLFPALSDRKVTVLLVNKTGIWPEHEKASIRGWLQNNYSAIGFEVLKGDEEDQLFTYLSRRLNTFIVMGAYGRSELSRFFHESAADLLIKTVTRPIFITHL
ncbi:universal stress protein [Nostoc ellipsosporum NOK]|nr:universal stress protein [Nostoc ellipsosporum NOK]